MVKRAIESAPKVPYIKQVWEVRLPKPRSW